MRQPRTNKIRLLTWAVVLGTFAVATAAPWHNEPHNKQESGRKTTDAPAMSKGKLGQDLFMAIGRRDIKTVQSLLKKGADPNSTNGLTLSPLHMAAASFQPDVMQALIAAGGKPDVHTPYGTPLTFAAISGNVPGAKMLFGKGADANFSRGDGNTPLMMASLSGSAAFINELIEHKADVNAKNYNDVTALGYAARSGHADAAKALLDGGAEVDATDNAGTTPLMSAAMTGHADVVKVLLAKGAKVNARDAKGRTPLNLAAAYGDYPEVVKTLLEGGADANIADAKGRTPAAFAAARGHKATSGLLGEPSAAAMTAVGPTPTTKSAIASSLKILQSSMTEFNRNTQCISCHQEGLGRMATGSARDKGYKIDGALVKAQTMRVAGALNAMKPLHAAALKNPEAMKQLPLIEINEVTTGYTWLMAGMAAHNQPKDAAAELAAQIIAKQQAPNGAWTFALPRIPMQSSNFTFTALAARDLNIYAPKSAAKDVAQRLAKAKSWLLKTPAKTSDDLVFRLLGLKWTGATKAEIATAMKELLAAQQPDGGWAQVPGMSSDAYATGQVLYALKIGGGLPVTSKVYQAGVSYLLRTQDADGTWFVNKRAFPANNYMDGGFPHGESQYSSFNGTAWALMALLETVGKK